MMVHVLSLSSMSVSLFYLNANANTLTLRSVQLGRRRSELQQAISARNPVLKIKRLILNMSLSKQVSEFLKLNKESRIYPGNKE